MVDMSPMVPPRNFMPAEDARLTFMFNMYYQLPNDDATQYQFAADRISNSKDDVYSHKQTVHSDWVKLAFGWFDPSQVLGIVIYNKTGLGRAIAPTEEEKASDATAVLELSNPMGLVVPPRLFTVIWYKDFSSVNVRSLGSPAKIQYMLVPK